MWLLRRREAVRTVLCGYWGEEWLLGQCYVVIEEKSGC